MAAKTRTEKTPLAKELVKNSQDFSFVQAMRILYATFKNKERLDFRDIVTVRPELSMDFPGTDIADIEIHNNRIRMDVTFLGLYGASSPLPNFYTEELIDEENDGYSTSREFLDILHNPIYHLFFESWKKYKISSLLLEEGREDIEDIVCSLVGLGQKSLRENIPYSKNLVKYAGLISQSPRSAEGLRSIISHYLRLRNVSIQECVSRKVKILDEQHALLGESSNVLGENVVIGEEIEDLSGKFRIIVHIEKSKDLKTIFPNHEHYQELKNLVAFYLDVPLEWDLELVIQSRILKGAVIGTGSWSRLGYDTWLGVETLEEEQRVMIDPIYEQRKEYAS